MKPLIIGITGGSGSGKTSFIRDLQAKFKEGQISVIAQDNYYKPRQEQQEDTNGWINFDLPAAIDREAFLNDILKLVEGKAVSRQDYVFNNDIDKATYHTVQPASILIIEGLFVHYFNEIRNLLDLSIFIHAKENLKVIRRIKRDQEERNYDLEEVLYRYENHVIPTFEKYILPCMQEADFIINNNKYFQKALDVLEGYLKYFLKEKREE